MEDANLELQAAAARMNDVTLRIAKLIGQPINAQLPVAVELTEMADVDVAEPGEKVFYFASEDTDPDEIYYVNTSTGKMVPVKRTPVSDTELTFQGLNSRIEYVLIDTVLSSPDVAVLARKKAHIAMGMDKLEVKLILDAIISDSDVTEITVASGEDLYDVIMKMKQDVEDYGDDYLLLCGSDVMNNIDTFDKRQAETFNYNVTLKDQLAKVGIKALKIFGAIKSGTAAENEGDSGQSTALLDADKMILIARNSRIAQGKPLHFVRRKISADIAKLMGADVDTAQRALIVNPTPVNVSGTNTLAYGVYGYESVIWAVKNVNAICKSEDLTAILW